MEGTYAQVTCVPCRLEAPLTYNFSFEPVDACLFMAGRSAVDDVPLRRQFEDENVDERVIGWSPWFHLDEKSSDAEIEAANEAKVSYEKDLDKSTMLYNIQMVFPWLWTWVERILGETSEAIEWRFDHPQSMVDSQKHVWSSAKNVINYYLQLSRYLIQDP